jgi:hypothetical protein
MSPTQEPAELFGFATKVPPGLGDLVEPSQMPPPEEQDETGGEKEHDAGDENRRAAQPDAQRQQCRAIEGEEARRDEGE